MRASNRKPESLLSRSDIEMLDALELWAETRFQNMSKIRDLYIEDHRPKVECQVLLAMIRSVKDVRDFYTLPL